MSDKFVPESWLSNDQWQILHSQIRPNTRTVSQFAQLVAGGQLDVYKRNDIIQVERRLKELMVESGKFRAEDEGGGRTKSDIAQSMKSWVLQRNTMSKTQRRDAAMSQMRAVGSRPGASKEEQELAETAVLALEGVGVDYYEPEFIEGELAKLRSRVAKIKDNTPTPSKGKHDRSLEKSHKRSREKSESSMVDGKLLIKTQPPHPEETQVSRGDSGLFLKAARQLRTPPPPPEQSGTPFGPFESPMLKILCSLKRSTIRFGQTFVTFDIPEAHFSNVLSRTLRLVILPVDGIGFVPRCWPGVKDLALNVNRTSYQQGWKRGWPKREHELQKSYLPLDITALLLRSNPNQSITFECFNREYQCGIIIAIAQPVTEHLVADEFLALFSSETQKGEFRRNISDHAIQQVYRKAVSHYDTNDDDCAADSDVITLKCPISHLRISTPVRGRYCEHLQCFDLVSVVRHNHNNSYWNCPSCDKPLRIDDIVIDTLVLKAIKANENASFLRLVPSQPIHWIPCSRVPKSDKSAVFLDENTSQSNISFYRDEDGPCTSYASLRPRATTEGTAANPISL